MRTPSPLLALALGVTACSSPGIESSFVVGGGEVPIAAAPWQVALYEGMPAPSFDEFMANGFVTRLRGPLAPRNVKVAESGGMDYYHLCGGTIVADKWILTAAHCVATPDMVAEYGLVGIDYKILAGSADLACARMLLEMPTTAEPDPAACENARVYDVDLDGAVFSDEADMVMLPILEHLRDGVILRREGFAGIEEIPGAIAKIDLYPADPADPTAWPAEGTLTFTSGWGLSSSATSVSWKDELRGAAQQVWSLADAEQALADLGEPWPIMPTEVAVKHVEQETVVGDLTLQPGDSCWGDSGGPLAVLDDATQLWQLLGVVSWGPNSCGVEGAPSIYAYVGAMNEWIQAVIDGTLPEPIPEEPAECNLDDLPRWGGIGEVCSDAFDLTSNGRVWRCAITVDGRPRAQFCDVSYNSTTPTWQTWTGALSEDACCECNGLVTDTRGAVPSACDRP